MRNIVIVIALLLCWYACSDDNTEIPQVSGITRTTFVDERDMTEYECIVVNGQTWLAENLRYRLPLGALEGCYTFDETTVSASAEEFVPIVRAALEAGEIVDPMPTPLFNSMSFLLDNLDGVYYTVDNFMSNYVDYPDVLAQLEKCEEEAMVGSVAAALVDFDAQNGGYSEKYGFLYTYEAAQAALPEGWRLPTDADWQALEKALGMSASEANKEEAWRGEYEGLLMKEGEHGVGFNVKMGGGMLYGKFAYGSDFQNDNSYAYFWTGTTDRMNDSVQIAYIRKLNYLENRVFRGTSSLEKTAYSVRAIKE